MDAATAAGTAMIMDLVSLPPKPPPILLVLTTTLLADTPSAEAICS